MSGEEPKMPAIVILQALAQGVAPELIGWLINKHEAGEHVTAAEFEEQRARIAALSGRLVPKKEGA